MMRTNRRLRSRRDLSGAAATAGFSLIELVVAMAMMLVAVAGIYRTLKTASGSASSLSEMSQQQSDSRRVMDVLVSDLRMAWTGDGSNLDRVQGDFGPCSVTFYAPTRDASAKLRRIRYSMSGSNLSRSETVSTNVATVAAPVWTWPGTVPAPVWSPAIVVLRGIHNDPSDVVNGCTQSAPLFRYYTSADALINSAAPSAAIAQTIKRVSLYLRVDRVLDRVPEPDVFSTSVEMRSK